MISFLCGEDCVGETTQVRRMGEVCRWIAMLSAFFCAQGHIRKLAALLHAPRAASREKGIPYLILNGSMDQSFPVNKK